MKDVSRRSFLLGSVGTLFLGARAAAGMTEDGQSAQRISRQGSQAEAVPTLPLNAAGLLDRSCFLGVDTPVELIDGAKKPAINFDNAATTPALVVVAEAIMADLPMYGSVGRGKGQKSTLTTERFDECRTKVLKFFGAPADTYSCAFTGTTTDALNKIASALIDDESQVVLTTRSEHHANDLPWRERATMRYVEVDELGRLRMDDFKRELADGKVKVVTVQAASNVTGYVHDVHAIAKMAHEAGAIMVVDGAQIAAHRPFSLKGEDEASSIDFFCTSAHKMYAPFGGGCLIGNTKIMNETLPRYRGGGMVDVVLDNDVTWLPAPERFEAGSPNFLGQVAFAKTIEAFELVGFDAIERHEQELLSRAITGLAAIPGVTLYGDCENIKDRVGVLTFQINGVDAADVAQQLADNWGIAVRQGEFCAHPLCHRLMGYTDADIIRAMQAPNFQAPAMVRVSFGMYNDADEVDTLIEAVREIAGA